MLLATMTGGARGMREWHRRGVSLAFFFCSFIGLDTASGDDAGIWVRKNGKAGSLFVTVGNVNVLLKLSPFA